MTSRARAIVGLLTLLGPCGGCGAEPVEARAIWVDDLTAGSEGRRRIHVYDRGAVDSIELLGAREPIQRIRLDPWGRGVLVRAGDRRGVWMDLDDGRRLPLTLPPAGLGARPSVELGREALVWIDDLDGSLAVVPLAPGLALERDADGSISPLRRGAGLAWTKAAGAAPVVLAASLGGGRASLVRYPDRAGQPLTVALEADAEGLSLPPIVTELHQCSSALGCYVDAAVASDGSLAVFASQPEGPWQQLDARAPAQAGPLALPDLLAQAAAGPGLRLLALLDRHRSVWIGAGQIYRWDHQAQVVDNLPLFASPPLRWTSTDEGRAVVISSIAGPAYRADRDGLTIINLETTVCPGPGDPVVSADGRWLAWTCVDAEAEQVATSGVIIRVSEAGLERYAGVPMATVAIDDQGDLLLYSVESSLADAVDGVAPTNVPRNLFTLARDGVLTRVDELEPAPAPVLVGAGELAAYLQGVALGG